MTLSSGPRVVVLCGGVGAAKLLTGLTQVVDDAALTAIVNVGDDLVLHGLHISPDLDTIVYTLADAVSPERGWGLDGETWQAMEMLGRYGGVDWFNLGDRDLGTHLFRTHRLGQGDTLTGATAAIAAAWDIGFRLLPVTDDPLTTMVTTVDEGEIPFQEYFVRRRHDVTVTNVRFDGAADTEPGPEVLAAIAEADRIIIAPSNPVVSIDPLLAVPGITEALQDRRSEVVAVSPIIGGKALKGPADRLLAEMGLTSSAAGVAAWYTAAERNVIGTLVIDSVDAELASAVSETGVEVVMTDTIMSDRERAKALAEILVGDA